jgi:hypothetical protein
MRTFLCLIFTSLIYSQVVNSEIESINPEQQLKDIKNFSTASTIFSFERLGRNKNIALTSFLVAGNQNSSFRRAQVLVGSIKISWNLDLIGRMSTAYSNKNNALNIYGWGISYKPGKEEKISPWSYGINSGVSRLYNINRSSSFSLSIMRSVLLNNYSFSLGVSSVNVKGVNYSVGQNFQYNFSNFIIGTTINFSGIKVLPNYTYSSNNSMISVGLQKEF